MFHSEWRQKLQGCFVGKGVSLVQRARLRDDILLLHADIRWLRPPLGYEATLTSVRCNGEANPAIFTEKSKQADFLQINYPLI